MTSFEISELPDYNIIIGPYPQNEEDIEVLSKNGVNAVLCVQSYKDFKHRGIDQDKVKNLIEKHGMELTHISITDFDQNDLIHKLPEASKVLKRLHDEEQKKVYVH